MPSGRAFSARLVAVTVFAAVAASEGISAEDRAAGMKFTVDGEIEHPSVVSLRGAPDDPQEGDLADIDGIFLTLGSERSLEFRTSPEEDGRLLLLRKDANPMVVGVRVAWHYEKDSRVLRNPLAKMSEDEIRALRGVRLEAWTPEIAERLKHLDAARVCLTVTDGVVGRDKGAMPTLPEGLVHLRIEESSNQGITDYTPLARLKSLKSLTIHAMTAPVDAGLLRGAKGLRHLEIRARGLKNPAGLSSLTELAFLGLAFNRELDGVAFAAAMPSLVRLDIRATKVTDLSPLAGLDRLTTVEADQCPVSRLPEGKLPALRKLAVLSSEVSEADADKFAKAHPACEVLFRWDRKLRAALEGADKVRVRSGGTCHRDPRREKTLIEEPDAAKIAALVAGIALDEKESGFHCMCCGDPSIEFYRGGKLVVTLGFHHGHGLRWPGVWPGDAKLTAESGRLLCKWMAERGLAEPLRQREQQERAEAAGKRRRRKYAAIMTDPVSKKLEKAESAEDAVAAFETSIPKPSERAAVYLRLIGCEQGAWNVSDNFGRFVEETLLPSVKKADLAEALAGAADDQAVDGAARWLFGSRKWDEIDGKVLQAALPVIGRRALGHPRDFNRRAAIDQLGQMADPVSLALLRAVLAGEIQPRRLPEGEEEEPGGFATFRPGDGDLPAGSDRAHAALVLAKRGDKDSLPALRKLEASATGGDKKVLAKAVELLERK